MKKLFLIILFQFSILSCCAQSSTSLINAIKKHKPDWINSWKEYPFEEVRVSPKKEIDWVLYTDNTDTTGLSLNEPEYIYSPDKKYMVDVYSVRFLFYENENGEKFFCGGDPDVGIFLFDFDNKKVYRMLYFGTGEAYDDVLWLSNTSFVILTSFHLQPQLIVIDVKNRTWVFYWFKKNKPKFDYIEKKFLKLGYKTDCW